MDVAIIGSGHMARGIGIRLISGGNHVTVIDRKPERSALLAGELKSRAKDGGTSGTLPFSAPIPASVIILALPYEAALGAVASYDDMLSGKIIVDITNPVNFDTFEPVVPTGSSAAMEIARRVPKATKVVKAFNTTFAGTLVEGVVDGKPLDVFVASDDEDAKRTVMELVESGNMRALDAGNLGYASILEGIQRIQMKLQQKLGTGWMSTIKILG